MAAWGRLTLLDDDKVLVGDFVTAVQHVNGALLILQLCGDCEGMNVLRQNIMTMLLAFVYENQLFALGNTRDTMHKPDFSLTYAQYVSICEEYVGCLGLDSGEMTQ